MEPVDTSPVIDPETQSKADAAVDENSSTGKFWRKMVDAGYPDVKMSDVPFAIADATSLTEAGYVGEDVENVLLRLLQVSNFDAKRAELGIIYVDEIDKIVTPSTGHKSHQASAEGVQQDLLPIIEGTTVTTKSNIQVKTDKILFICSGAFHSVKPSDMLAELQGRLPIRVELKPLTEADFFRIITEPKFNLIRQNEALLATEGVTLEVTGLWLLPGAGSTRM